ncbi:MAG: hypothetical protein ACLSDM_07520 [Butyricicoccus sp.]
MPRAFLNREPFSSYSHFIGAVLSGAGLSCCSCGCCSIRPSPARWRRLPWCSACR